MGEVLKRVGIEQTGGGDTILCVHNNQTSFTRNFSEVRANKHADNKEETER